MPLEPINVELSRFEKVKILRDEREARAEELAEVERTLRERLRELETQRFLESMSPYYAANAREIASSEDLRQLEERRRALAELIDTIDRQIPALLNADGSEPEGSPQEPGQKPADAARPKVARKAKFDF
jgi:hypothetical protein